MPTALVTGGSRGVGRGVARALAGAGYNVFASGRSIQSADLPASVVRLTCDHTRDADTEAAFAAVMEQYGGLDLLVNCCWGGYEQMVEQGRFTWPDPFWSQPLHRWNSMMNAGVRAAFIASACAARIMLPRRHGLIVNISFWAAQKYVGNAIYGIAKAATDKMSADLAHELRPHGIAVVSLYPGLVRTEATLPAINAGWIDGSNSESPEFTGLVIARLADDPDLMKRSGSVLIGAALAQEFGISDIDGRQPRRLTIESV